MFDHLPTKADIARYNNGHSVFAPSSGHMHYTCAASLLVNFGKSDHGSPDAAYGTVGHMLGEQWLKGALSEINVFGVNKESYLSDEWIDKWSPTDRIGEIISVDKGGGSDESYKITIDEDMIYHVRRYVKWCLELDGDHFVETRVSTEELTPIPNQGGTADHAACEPYVLTITDLKMGRGEAVYPAMQLDNPCWYLDLATGEPNGNVQAMLYAHGFITAYTHLYNFDKVVIRIAQPPRDYFGVWETTVDQIMEFGEAYKARARLNWSLGQPRTASVKGCRWCKGKASCGAWLVLFNAMTDGLADDTFEPVDDGPVIEGVFREVTGTEIVSAGKALSLKMAFGTNLAHVGEMTTLQMEQIKRWRKAFDSFFLDVDAELLHRARDGEQLRLHKLVPGRKGRRELIDKVEEAAELVGLDEDELYDRVLKTPVQLDETVRRKYKVTKAVATAIVSALTTRRDGQDTLAPISDDRDAMEDIGSVFDDVS